MLMQQLPSALVALLPVIVFLAALLWLGAAAALAQPAAGVVTVGEGDKFVLSKSFLFLEDKDSKLTFADVSKPELQQMFQPVPQVMFDAVKR